MEVKIVSKEEVDGICSMIKGDDIDVEMALDTIRTLFYDHVFEEKHWDEIKRVGIRKQDGIFSQLWNMPSRVERSPEVLKFLYGN
jgi:hypothetical protein